MPSFLSHPVPRSLALVALYVLAGAFALSITPDNGLPLYWPASGIALVAVVRLGLTWVLFIPVAVVILHATMAPVPTPFLPFLLASYTLGALAGGWLIRRGSIGSTLSVHFAFRFLLGAFVTALVSASIASIGLLVTDTAAEPITAFSTWLLSNLLGIASVSPALILAISSPAEIGRDVPANHYASDHERLLWNIALTASYLLMAWGGSLSSSYSLGLTALPLIVLVWSAVRMRLQRTAWSILGTMALIAVMAGTGQGGYSVPTQAMDVISLLIFLNVLMAIPMILAISVHQHRIASLILIHRATIDPLTGLANRNAFEEKVRGELSNPAAPPMALAYLDLDHFKLINDTASHVAGDALIRAVASVIESCRHREDMVARTGGDEFALLFRNCTPMVAEDRARILLRAIEGYRFGWEGQALSTTASVGLVAFLPGQSEYAQLLSQADAACFTAKEMGGNRVCLASPQAGDLLDRTTAMRWAVRLREALEHSTLEIYCQSIVPLHDHDDRGRHFEVLLRLRDPHTGDMMMPAHFMPAAERFHLGTRIDREVFSRTLQWLEENPRAAAATSLCCINLSAEALVNESFISFVAERLRNSQFPADRLCFEVTETSAVRDLARAQRFISDMKKLGCRFALDDFGTGFCSFNYLRALDVDFFKIDGSFVRDIETSPLAEAVVRSITHIAHVLNKCSIAEHTESDRIRQALIEMGVDYAQGYCIDKPIPIADYFRDELGTHVT